MSKPTVFAMGADARLLYQHLKSAEYGKDVTYSDLSSAIGKPIRQAFGALRTARIRLLRDEGLVFGTVRGVGLRLLRDDEIVATSSHDRSALRRRARRAAERVGSVKDFSALPPNRQLEHNAALSIFGAVASITTDKSAQKIEHAVRGRSSELPLSETMKALKIAGF